MQLISVELSDGSSPLARGKHFSYHWNFDSGGLIPARAGKTALRNLSEDDSRAHPRSRGEN